MTLKSSTISAVCGSNSLTQVPAFPWGAKREFRRPQSEAASVPRSCVVIRWPMRIESGSSWLKSPASFGLWSNRSICEGRRP